MLVELLIPKQACQFVVTTSLNTSHRLKGVLVCVAHELFIYHQSNFLLTCVHVM